MVYVKTLIVLIGFCVLGACSGKKLEKQAQSISTSYCQCIESTGMDTPADYQALAIGNKADIMGQIDSCTTQFRLRAAESIDKAEKNDRTELMKHIVKAFIDSPCGISASKALPYELLTNWYNEK